MRPRNFRPVTWIFCTLALFFLVIGYLLPAQSYGSALTCVPPANLTNCEDQSTFTADASETTETPLVLPDISPERDDLRGSAVPERNLAASALDLDEDEDTISDASKGASSETTGLDTDQGDADQVSSDEDSEDNVDDGDEGTDSGNPNSGSNEDSGPSLLPFP